MMKKIAFANLDTLFAAIADTKALYLPVADGADPKRGAKYAAWAPGVSYSTAVNTVRSAKDFFFPQVERLMNFKVDGKKIEVEDIREDCGDFVIFGVRACDAASFAILDSVYLVDPIDTYYQNRREHGIIITMACTKPTETCFCTVFGDIDATEPGGDITCWIDGENVLLRANTEKGTALLDSLSMLEDAEDTAADASKAATKEILAKLPLNSVSVDELHADTLMELFDNPKWNELSEACLGCGTCTFVCPTCQCYDIRDYDTGHGIERFRCWDSCMYSDFTQCAAANPRTTQMQRFRQRFMHKLCYYPDNHDGKFGCVGCGRCLKSCPISMNIVKVIQALEEEAQ